LSSAGQTVSAALPSLSGRVDQRRLLWWGGLAAAGTIGLLEWPVVAAVGIGSYVAEQFAKNGQTPQQRPTVPAPPYTAPTA
jgi:2-keto-3-deoxy-6-phosphogluconate aldolase